MEEILIAIGGAALAGGVYGLIGYFKNKKQEEAFEGFDTNSFLVNVVGSAIIGGVAAYQGLTPDAVTASALGAFIFQLVRKALKAVI